MKTDASWQAWIDRNGIRILDTLPDGWNLLKGAAHAPRGYAWAGNGRSMFDENHEYALVRIDPRGTLHSAQ